jgi:prepilin-type N-terminal cleavage/methylation domain-containing protein
MKTDKNAINRGFTIVELLIVIVIIGILVGIVIVSYNGVTQKARVSTLQNDLSQAASTLELTNANNSSFPADLTSAALKASPGTSYQYSYTASTNSYCLTGTAYNVSYYLSNTAKSPTVGGCPGHGLNGANAITNLAINPSLEGSVTNWSSSIDMTTTRVAGGKSGSWQVNYTRAGSGDAYGLYNLPGLGIANKTYTISLWAKSSGTFAMYSSSFMQEISGGWRWMGDLIGDGQTVPTTWTRYSTTFTCPSDVTPDIRIIMRTGSTIGQTVSYDAVMVTEGTGVYNYADGNSPGWIWNGTVNNSTSTGSPL